MIQVASHNAAVQAYGGKLDYAKEIGILSARGQAMTRVEYGIGGKPSVRSMTGFGRSLGQTELGVLAVEVRGVNNRYLDISVRLSRELSFAEEQMKNIVKEYVSRGRVDISVRLQSGTAQRDVARLDAVRARDMLTQLRNLALTLDLPDDISLSELVSLPGVLIEAPLEVDEEGTTSVLVALLREALEAFSASRLAEGMSLAADMSGRVKLISQRIDDIEIHTAGIVEAQRRRLRDNIERLLPDITVDSHRLELEVALFADRVSVAEELVRLRTHLKNYLSFLASTEAVGRKMDFYLQEINREINTIGSKVPDAAVSQHVVEIKAELEKIREQAQNIE